MREYLFERPSKYSVVSRVAYLFFGAPTFELRHGLTAANCLLSFHEADCADARSTHLVPQQQGSKLYCSCSLVLCNRWVHAVVL